MKALWYVRQEVRNFLKRQSFRKLRHPEIAHELKTKGVFAIPDFLSANTCAELRGEIDRLIHKYEKEIWTDPVGCDRRIFGANEFSEGLNQYFKNEFIRDVILDFENGSEIKGFTMAARLDYKPGNLGSGNGWHRDSAFYSQTKSIIYLSNANLENGPFEYIIGSQSPAAFVRGWMKKKDRLDKYRFTDEDVASYLSDFPEQKSIKFPAKEGTLLFADTRGIHRGSPIQTGTRYAATNYFFVKVDPPAHLLEATVSHKIGKNAGKNADNNDSSAGT